MHSTFSFPPPLPSGLPLGNPFPPPTDCSADHNEDHHLDYLTLPADMPPDELPPHSPPLNFPGNLFEVVPPTVSSSSRDGRDSRDSRDSLAGEGVGNGENINRRGGRRREGKKGGTAERGLGSLLPGSTEEEDRRFREEQRAEVSARVFSFFGGGCKIEYLEQ